MGAKVSRPYVLACRDTCFVVRCPSLATRTVAPKPRSVQPHERRYLTAGEQRRLVLLMLSHTLPTPKGTQPNVPTLPEAPLARSVAQTISRQVPTARSDVSPTLMRMPYTLHTCLPYRDYRDYLALPSTLRPARQEFHFNLRRSLSNINLGYFGASCSTGAQYLASETCALLRPIPGPVRPYGRPRHTTGIVRSLARCPESPCPSAHPVLHRYRFRSRLPRCAAWVFACHSATHLASITTLVHGLSS